MKVWQCAVCENTITDTMFKTARYNYPCRCGLQHIGDYHLKVLEDPDEHSSLGKPDSDPED